MADAPETVSARRRKIARRIAIGLVLAGAGAYVGGKISTLLHDRKFLKELSESKDWTTFDKLDQDGKLPNRSTVMFGKFIPKNTLMARMVRFITRGGLKPTYGAEGSYCLNNYLGQPIFFFGDSPDKLSDRVVRHEVGHYKAQMRRRHPYDYVRDSLNAKKREGGWLDLFNPGRLKYRDGRPTNVGIETEAWDLAGVPAGDKLREAAIGTYKNQAAVRSLNRYAYLSGAIGVGAGTYGFINPGDDRKKRGHHITTGIPKHLKEQLADGRAVINN